jgi:hypothetical protein
MPRTLIATYCEPDKWHLNWQLHSLFESYLALPDRRHIDFLATIPRGTRHHLDPRIPVRYRQPIGHRYRNPWLMPRMGLDHYPHVNSFLASAGLQTRHEFILQTDCDTVLTERFAAHRPAGFVCGAHDYTTEKLAHRLDQFTRKYGYKRGKVIDLGPTWYGAAADVRRSSETAMIISRQLLAEDWTDPADGEVFLTTLYASQIALHQHVRGLRRTPGLLDGRSESTPATNEIHLHMWMNPDWNTGFSKLAFKKGYYEQPGVTPRSGKAALLEKFARLGWASSAKQRRLRRTRRKLALELDLDAELDAVARDVLSRKSAFTEAEIYALAPGYPIQFIHALLDGLVDSGALAAAPA